MWNVVQYFQHIAGVLEILNCTPHSMVKFNNKPYNEKVRVYLRHNYIKYRDLGYV